VKVYEDRAVNKRDANNYNTVSGCRQWVFLDPRPISQRKTVPNWIYPVGWFFGVTRGEAADFGIDKFRPSVSEYLRKGTHSLKEKMRSGPDIFRTRKCCETLAPFARACGFTP
jgi:hypothetical protein